MNAPMKKDYELAIDAFVEAEKNYKQLEEHFLSGEAMVEIITRSGGNTEIAKREFQSLVELLKNRLDELNTLCATAKNALRQAVQLVPSQQRGPDGKASTLSYGPFKVESGTKRWLDPKDLLRGAVRHGVLDQLLSLSGYDNEGKQYKLVEQSWKIDYQNVSKWLKEQGLTGVLNGSYDEAEGTPRVTGPKPLAFLGEKIEKS